MSKKLIYLVSFVFVLSLVGSASAQLPKGWQSQDINTTGGSAEGPTAGVIFFLKLPNSRIVVRVPALRSWVNVDNPEPGMGVMPDIVVRPTAEDWLAGRDVVLERARRDQAPGNPRSCRF